jgi:Protein of unknown function (DUF3303)
MKCVVAWKVRVNGSAADNEATAARILEVASKWAPASGTTIHQWVLRVDGQGGFAIQDSDDLSSLTLSLAKLAPYIEIEVIPVLDYDEALPLFTEAVEFRNSVN